MQIRKQLARDNTPHHPREYALVTNLYAPTSNPASTRSITFYPIPNAAYTYTGTGRLQLTNLDSTNLYPHGGDVLAPVLLEAVLAQAERNLENKDASSPDAVHNRQFMRLLADAVQRDKEESTPDTVGIDHGDEYIGLGYGRNRRILANTLWTGGGGYEGWL